MLRRKKRRTVRKGSGQPPLRMTSMMDILTVLLLFLLKSFVVEGEVITPVPGVNLPESTSEDTPEASVVVAIFQDSIMLDGQKVGSVSEALASDDLLIASLADRLSRNRERGAEIARRRGETEDFRGRVAIQGDQDISFAILERVMFTCNQSGYEDISLAVIGVS